ncbi:MAG: NADH-cytochrome b5 reductase [Thelocarpon impressellum]|nr:MAG: NADH-cytochrome b5 reductase [Thelocarpon impressellum]
MFARSALWSAQPLRSSIRHYSTESPKAAGSNTALYGALAAAAGVGGYYFLNQPKKTDGDAPTPSKEQVASRLTGNQSVAFKGGDQGWIDLKLDKVEEINHNTKRLRFLLPDENDVSGLPITSAVLTKYKGPQDEKPTVRPYTPVSGEDLKGYLDFIIKRYPGGPMSQHLHDMKPQQRLSFKGPIPKYPWEANKHDHIAMIAGGTGITPMFQLARHIFANPEDKTKVTLVFGNIGEEDILLKRELEDLENTYPQRFRAFYVLEKPAESWQQGTGRIDKSLLKTVLPEPGAGDVKVFVCGPPGMYKAISGPKKSPSDQGELDGVLKELGYAKEQVYKF